jgi:UDP-N-acetylmuramoyl-tripeptide--D-alanyl-D-alanine ligase
MTTLLAVLAVLATLFAGWRAGRRVRFFLHVFQLETYKLDRFAGWVRAHARAKGATLSHAVGAGLLAASAAAFAAAPDGGAVAAGVAAALLLLWTGTFVSSRRYRRDQEKKPLAFTARMTRLAIATGAVALVPIALGAWQGWGAGLPEGAWWYLLGFYVADLGAPLWVAAGAALMRPVETAIQEGFKRQARATLRERPDLTVVGITGSYGKTSTKFILAELLRQKYNVLETPSSYNTPMGICLAVNEHLRPEHQVLVLEMGIRYPGDLRELCDIAAPDLSVVTTVGVAHLETMGSIEAIAEEKGSILDHMKDGGPAVLNADDERVAAMGDRASGPVWRVSVEGREEADLTAHDVRYDTSGTAFEVRDDTGATATFRTRLLGAHNVLNVLLAAAVGRAMGLRLRQMAHAVRRVEPVEHRLALRQDGEVTVIDDAFNSNPVGARNAVEILAGMDGGRHVIVTPGMVELGERQWEENEALGRHIAAHDVDLAVLVGDEQTAPLQAGLREAGFPEDRLRVVSSLFDAQELLQSYLEPGDVVLYENDLPDQY